MTVRDLANAIPTLGSVDYYIGAPTLGSVGYYGTVGYYVGDDAAAEVNHAAALGDDAAAALGVGSDGLAADGIVCERLHVLLRIAAGKVEQVNALEVGNVGLRVEIPDRCETINSFLVDKREAFGIPSHED